MILVTRERVSQELASRLRAKSESYNIGDGTYFDYEEANKKYLAAERKCRIVIEDTDTGECVRLNSRQVLQVIAGLLNLCWWRPETIQKESLRQRDAHWGFTRKIREELPVDHMGPLPIPEIEV